MKFMENYVGNDIKFTLTRTFDKDPRKPGGKLELGTMKYIVIGGPDMRDMAVEEADRKNSRWYTDSQVPIVWYSCGGGLVNQREVLIYIVLPDLIMERQVNEAQIIWVPSHETRADINYMADIMEILDGVVKVKEFNIYSDTEFKLGFARNWFG